MAEEFQDNNKDAGVVLSILLMLILSAAVWFIHVVYDITYEQVIIAASIVLLAGWVVYETIRYKATFQKKYEQMWPKPLVKVSPEQERKCLKEAIARDSILLGYDSYQRPFYWSDDIRKGQANCFGMTGAGKSTLLESILEQDIRRGVPVIFLDGKGESRFTDKIIRYAAAAGRLGDVRILDPQRPGLSVRYNPFYTEYNNIGEMTASVFESFKPEKTPEDFFDGHQRAFLSDVARILHYTGKVFTIYDVLVVTNSTEDLRKQINIALERARTLHPALPDDEMKNLEMAAYRLITNMEEDGENYISKLQGLTNKMVTYMDQGLSVITSQCDDLFTLDEAIDKNLIFIMILNSNTNKFAVASLGRIILQNFQLMVGMRYSRIKTGENPKFVSVILDEFAEFAYADFARIINQARGAGIGFIFSLQAETQLDGIGHGFKHTLTDAPNSRFMLRMLNNETTQEFIQSSGRELQTRTSVRAEKQGFIEPSFREQSSGTIQQVMDTRIADRQVKGLPTGQMMALIVNHEIGTRDLHLHVRASTDHLLDIPSPLYPQLLVPKSRSRGLNLRLSLPQPGSAVDRRRSGKRR